MTITKINVRFPRAPIDEIIILNNTFIVVHDWASFRTRNYRGEQHNKNNKNVVKVKRVPLAFQGDKKWTMPSTITTKWQKIYQS